MVVEIVVILVADIFRLSVIGYSKIYLPVVFPAAAPYPNRLAYGSCAAAPYISAAV